DPALASIQRQSDSAAALEQLRRHPAAERFRQQLARFLSRYGYLSLNADELRNPRWIEHPDQLLALLSGADLNSEGPSPSSRQVGLDPASPRPNGGALARPRRALSAWLRRRQSRWLVQQAESYTAMLGQLLPLRQRAMLLADRWVQQGWLDRADDLFFLSLTEIECVLQMGSPDAAGFSSTDLATHRRASHRRWRRRETTGVARRAEQLHGAPLSPGRVRGRARVVSDPSGAAAVRSGEILVTLAAEAGWTALFSRIGGLVIEMGHRHGPASTVARAIGLPAVANVSDATRRVVTGQWVVVDGHSGHIVLED
ncbi:MAG: PEP-utilizing enzyme, partial [Candidatus Promineifilaceae bacterium]|nr:PEP-utilizing enzyme [Candidatus Promineifilaceae bacterium]